ncbi:YihY family inner membrane protein [Nocardioidaceae bacterium]|nr:YihY family inner membrane protein [Nocardioidaceae bacterium]
MGPGTTTYVAEHHRDAAAGPEPDADIKPSSPRKLTKQSWRYIGKKTLAEFQEDQCTDVAASLTYYAVLALFPGLIALTSILGLIGQSGQAVEVVLNILRPLVSDGVETLAEDALTAMTQTSAAGFGLVFGLLGALFSASGYVNAFSRAMNRIYEVSEGRPIYKLRPQMILVTLVAVLLAALVLVMLIVSGPLAESIGREVGQAIGLENATISTATFVWAVAKWPVVFVIVVAIVALLYYATPNIKQPRFRWISVGAALAILIWIVASLLFAFYVANFGSYDKTYGTLAGVIVALLWLWITNLALLLGAELDSELERGRELQAGIPAEEELRLPARDTTGIVKSQKNAEDLLERGRAIREQADPDGRIAATYGVIEDGALVTTGSDADSRRAEDEVEAGGEVVSRVEQTKQDVADQVTSDDDGGSDPGMSDDTAQPSTADTESSKAADGEHTDDSDAPEEVDQADGSDQEAADSADEDPYEREHPTAPPKGQKVTHAGTQGEGMGTPQKALVGAGIAGAAFVTVRGVVSAVRSLRG